MLNIELVGESKSCDSECIEHCDGCIFCRSSDATSWIISNYGNTMKVKRTNGDDFGWNMEYCNGDEYGKSVVDQIHGTSTEVSRFRKGGCVGKGTVSSA